MNGPLAWKTAARNLSVLLIWMPKDQMEEAVQLVLQKIGLLITVGIWIPYIQTKGLFIVRNLDANFPNHIWKTKILSGIQITILTADYFIPLFRSPFEYWTVQLSFMFWWSGYRTCPLFRLLQYINAPASRGGLKVERPLLIQ